MNRDVEEMRAALEEFGLAPSEGTLQALLQSSLDDDNEEDCTEGTRAHTSELSSGHPSPHKTMSRVHSSRWGMVARVRRATSAIGADFQAESTPRDSLSPLMSPRPLCMPKGRGMWKHIHTDEQAPSHAEVLKYLNARTERRFTPAQHVRMYGRDIDSYRSTISNKANNVQPREAPICSPPLPDFSLKPLAQKQSDPSYFVVGGRQRPPSALPPLQERACDMFVQKIWYEAKASGVLHFSTKQLILRGKRQKQKLKKLAK